MSKDPGPHDEPVPASAAPPTAGTSPGGVAAGPRAADLPTEDELVRIAEPATVRRAPKFSAFLVAGAVVGIVVGVLLAFVIHPVAPREADGSGFLPFLDGDNAVRTVMAVAGGVLGAFVGGALAVLADRRSTRSARPGPG